MISYRTEHISISVLMKGMAEGHITTRQHDIFTGRYVAHSIGNPLREFNREDFITSIFAGMPVYPLTFDGTVRPWKVIHGKLQLDAIREFWEGEFMISRSRYLPLPEPQHFKELPFILRRRFEITKVPCFVINPPTSRFEIEDIKTYFKTFYD